MTYDPAGTKCLGGNQPGAVILMEATIAYFPPAYNLGIYACRPVRGGATMSVHAEGRAGDTGFRLKDGKIDPAGTACADWLVANHEDFGVQVVIWNRRIWSLPKPFWHPYTGSDPHTGHNHWELNWWGAKNLTRSVVESHRPSHTPEPPEEEDVNRVYSYDGHYWATNMIVTRQITGSIDFNYFINPGGKPRAEDLGAGNPVFHKSMRDVTPDPA